MNVNVHMDYAGHAQITISIMHEMKPMQIIV